MLVSLLVTLLVAIIIVAVSFWIIDQIVGDPKLNKVCKVIVVVLCLLYFLGGLAGHAPLVPVRW